jgi:hypothetical protein
VLADDNQFPRFGAGFHRFQANAPVSPGIHGGGIFLTGKFHRDFFARIGRPPHGNIFIALQHHVVGERARKPHAAPRGTRQDDGHNYYGRGKKFVHNFNGQPKKFFTAFHRRVAAAKYLKIETIAGNKNNATMQTLGLP